MKKSFYSIIAIALIAFVFSSCGKDTPVDPGNGGGDDGGGDMGNHPELWHYDGKIKGLADIFPAIDENGNMYFAGTDQDAAEGTFHFVSLDKNGHERWDKVINADAASYVIYADGKVFFATQDPAVTINAYNANDGSLIWSKNYTTDNNFIWMPAIAYSNHKLYATSGQMLEGFLFVINPDDGSEYWMRRLFEKNFLNIAVDGTKIYFGGMGEVNRFDDLGTVSDSIWQWTNDKSGSRGFAYNDITIADDGYLYIRESLKVYILSPDNGQAITTVDLGTEFNSSPSGVAVDGDGNFYIGNGDWYKYSRSGNLVWKTDITAGFINPNYIEAPTIAENGFLYNGEAFSLTCVNTDGTLNWMLGTEEGVGNLHPVVIDSDGNLIVYSTEKGVLYCYKGDGKKLATNGWPKRFGNMGNTCSK